MHVHTCTMLNQRWTPLSEEGEDARKITFDMQIKGIVKYCTPNSISIKAWRDAFGVCFTHYKTDLFEFIDNFVMKVNPEWKGAIQETISELLGSIY